MPQARALRTAVLFLVFAAATWTRADPDLWGHLRFGLDTLHQHYLTSVDPYSFTRDVPWINHEWLSEAQMGLAWTIGGVAGLALLKGSLVFVAFVLVWSATRGLRGDARAALLVLVAIGTIHMWASLRPQLWTLLSFALLCRILLAEHRRVRWWLPLLFAVWVNCHGGWIVGLGMLGVWSAASIAGRLEDAGSWVAVTAAAVAATLINPYGIGLWLFIWRTVHVGRSIEEWQPLWMAPGLNWLPWVAGVVATAWLVLRGPRNRHFWPTAGVLTMLAFTALRVQRLESLFVVGAAVLLAPHLIREWRGRMPRMPLPDNALKFAALAGAVVAACFAVFVLSRSLACIRVFGAWEPDAEAAASLRGASSGRVVTAFDWGQYAIWHFGPRLRVSMDGRRETVYSEARLSEYEDVLHGTPRGLETLGAWHAEYVWLPVGSQATRSWLSAHGYRIEVETARSFIAVRNDLPRLVIPSPPGDTPPGARCFPE